MSSALGTLTIDKVIELGGCKLIKCHLLGDTNYGGASGGTVGLLTEIRRQLKDSYLQIASCKGVSIPGTVSELEYDEAVFTTAGDPTTAIASGDKLLARVRTTGVESAVDDQHAITYKLFIVAY